MSRSARRLLPRTLRWCRRLLGRGLRRLGLRRKPVQPVAKSRPQRPGARLTRAKKLLAQGRPAEARRILDSILELDPSHIESHELLIEQNLREGAIAANRYLVRRLASHEAIPLRRQLDAVDLVVPFGDPEDLEVFSGNLQNSDAALALDFVRRIQDDAHDPFNDEISTANPQIVAIAHLALGNFGAAVNVASSLNDLPLSAMRRAIRRSHLRGESSRDFEHLVRLFLHERPRDRWVRKALVQIIKRRVANEEEQRWEAARSARYPLYWRPNGVSLATRAKRVMHVVHGPVPSDGGGTAARTNCLADALVDLGWDCVCVTRPDNPGPQAGPSVVTAVPGREQRYVRLPGSDGVSAKDSLFGYIEDYAQKLYDAVLEWQPEVIHATSSHWGSLAALEVANALRIPYVYEMRGVWGMTTGPVDVHYLTRGSFQQLLEREISIARAASHVVALNSAIGDLLASHGISQSRITIIPNGVDLGSPVGSPLSVASARPFTFGYKGSVAHSEGLDILLEASRLLGQRGIEHRLRVVLDGPGLGLIRGKARQLGISGNMHLTGQSDLDLFYREIDAAVFPRRNVSPRRVAPPPEEPFGAHAQGIPVVASDARGLMAIIEHERTGLLHVADSADSLAVQMERLIRDEPFRRRLGEAGMAKVARCGQWAHRAEQLSSVYELVVEPSSREISEA